MWRNGVKFDISCTALSHMTLQGTGQANLKGGTMMPISWFIVVENIDKCRKYRIILQRSLVIKRLMLKMWIYI